MRDLPTIDSELRLLVAIRHLVREEEGRTPNTRFIDQLLDERAPPPSARTQAERRRLAELGARADRQHAAVSAGDELVGVYGDYPLQPGEAYDDVCRALWTNAASVCAVRDSASVRRDGLAGVTEAVRQCRSASSGR
jgi:hypothetical protein